MPGILNARTAQENFQFSTIAPVTALAPFVAHYWLVAWDLRGRDPYEQQVLPYPSVNMTFTAGRCRIAGVPKGRFSEVLRDKGRVFGVRFQPGGFRPLLGAPVSSITNRFLPVDAVFGDAGRALTDAILAADNSTAAAIMDNFLTERVSKPDPTAEVVTAIASRIATDPRLTRVDEVAGEFDIGLRRLQRLFADYVGVGPKWVIRRYRLHEAAARAAKGADLDWVRLAFDLEYSDQAHFTRDFTAIVGVSPARYARAQ